MEDWPRSGRPSTSEVNIAKVKEIVIENPHSPFRQIATVISLYREKIRTILYNHLSILVCGLVEAYVP